MNKFRIIICMTITQIKMIKKIFLMTIKKTRKIQKMSIYYKMKLK